MNDNLTLTGKIQLHLNGELVLTKDNLIVTAGKTWVATLMQSGSGTPMSHMAVGTSGTSPAVGDTTLNAEIARVALSVNGGTRTNNQIAYVGVFPPGTGTGTIQEAGLLNASSNGTMLSHVTFASIAKGALDQLTITWTITVG